MTQIIHKISTSLKLNGSIISNFSNQASASLHNSLHYFHNLQFYFYHSFVVVERMIFLVATLSMLLVAGSNAGIAKYNPNILYEPVQAAGDKLSCVTICMERGWCTERERTSDSFSVECCEQCNDICLQTQGRNRKEECLERCKAGAQCSATDGECNAQCAMECRPGRHFENRVRGNSGQVHSCVQDTELEGNEQDQKKEKKKAKNKKGSKANGKSKRKGKKSKKAKKGKKNKSKKN